MLGAELGTQPCAGIRGLGTLEVGARLGPVELGLYGRFGPAVAFLGSGNERLDPHLSLGVAPGITVGAVTTRFTLGRAGGYAGQGWIEAGVKFRVRFPIRDPW